MEFHITTDEALIRSILVNPACYSRMKNDAAPSTGDFHFRLRADTVYVLVSAESLTLGLFFLVFTDGVVQIHFCFLPCAWGASREIGKEFLIWVWANTDLHSLQGHVPSYNRLALSLAKAVGFMEKDIKVGEISKNGKEYDLLILEIGRPQYATAAA